MFGYKKVREKISLQEAKVMINQLRNPEIKKKVGFRFPLFKKWFSGELYLLKYTQDKDYGSYRDVIRIVHPFVEDKIIDYVFSKFLYFSSSSQSKNFDYGYHTFYEKKGIEKHIVDIVEDDITSKYKMKIVYYINNNLAGQNDK